MKSGVEVQAFDCQAPERVLDYQRVGPTWLRRTRSDTTLAVACASHEHLVAFAVDIDG